MIIIYKAFGCVKCEVNELQLFHYIYIFGLSMFEYPPSSKVIINFLSQVLKLRIYDHNIFFYIPKDMI